MKTLILAISLLYSISHAEESITPSQSEQAKVVPPSTKTNKLIVDDKTLTSETLDPNSITGILGTPLHTIQLIVCKVTDMSFTGGKAD
ncbi:hypothetical protein SAMN02745181_3777 [Rubritalea squalenifaciens DSM 18772]|uniref:Uncharacterized protein n=1 Tax=Rubritalea squalenifaciens DSM 18772 TaxID=1123071 RepID=A0A1M6SB95_9BACT|nr:hypothetical protein [Rubritalea squalenifaciens]SHK42042.1 hypothetical protein SAMN02745181_3777 [Rubritalea squalenifaciens DSM 18772]